MQLKKLMRKFENVFSAVAFAEAGEFETAKEMLNEGDDVEDKSVKAEGKTSSRKHNVVTGHPSMKNA